MKLRGIEIVDDQKESVALAVMARSAKPEAETYPRDLVGLRYVRLIDRLPDMSELPADFVRDSDKVQESTAGMTHYTELIPERLYCIFLTYSALFLAPSCGPLFPYY